MPLTLRARLGFETGKAWNTSLLVEGEAVMPLQDDYRPDPAVPTDDRRIRWSPIRKAYEINRLQLTNTSLPGTTLTLGRQRIILDDQRFVGNVGWRQNEQTFDALRVVNRSVDEPGARRHLPQPGQSRVRSTIRRKATTRATASC